MSYDLNKQTKKLIDNASNILIVFKKNYTVDSLASALAIFNILKKEGKDITIACDKFEIRDNIRFLKGVDLIKDKLVNLRRFIINLHLKNAGVEEFSYDVDDNELKIFITPKNGFFEEKDITTGSSDFIFDLIIVVDSPDLESLSGLYENNRELFYKVPIINFDHTTINENFGQINLIDLKSVATSQVVYGFLKNNFNEIDDDVATLILAGIMVKTRVFKTFSITPDVLTITSELISFGADRGIIIKNLYQSKNLSTLKLWGRVLSKLQQDSSIKLVWSLITHEDFVKSGANIKDIHSAVEEIITSIPDSEIIIILFEKPDSSKEKNLKICAQIFTKPNYNSKELTRIFNSQGAKDFAEFCLDISNLMEAEKVVVDEIRKNVIDLI